MAGRLRQDATPGSPTGMDPLGKSIDSLIAQDRFAEALTKLRQLLDKSPDHVQARRKLGYCLMQTGQTTEAEHELGTLLAHHPHDPFALLHQGLNLVIQRRLPEAISMWRKYFNTDQPVIQRAVNLQIALFETGGPSDPEEVAAHIQQAIAEQQGMDHS